MVYEAMTRIAAYCLHINVSYWNIKNLFHLPYWIRIPYV